MCLIITVLAAIVSTAIWYISDNAKKYNTGTLTLMYWGASLMWLVDSIFRIAEGETFFEISTDDALLGTVIVACGLIVWIAILMIKNKKHILKTDL
jgi:hypothetical protein